MPIMYIKCPVTQKILSTGIDAYDIIPETLIAQEISCFYCDQIHTWKAEHVFFLKYHAVSDKEEKLTLVNTKITVK